MKSIYSLPSQSNITKKKKLQKEISIGNSISTHYHQRIIICMI
jgi:hypothetical protein